MTFRAVAYYHPEYRALYLLPPHITPQYTNLDTVLSRVCVPAQSSERARLMDPAKN